LTRIIFVIIFHNFILEIECILISTNQDGLVKKRLLFLRHYSGYWGYKTLNFSTLSQSFGRVKTLKFDFIFRINQIVKIHCWFQSFYYPLEWLHFGRAIYTRACTSDEIIGNGNNLAETICAIRGLVLSLLWRYVIPMRTQPFS